ncbi:hypothetical protein [Gloeocapsa sp. PCC 73106]|uniref:hypothetical protein n=1 Tax=Gloeocapsa sp. PCC 73106 TaxID=102232 RepID=UPI0002AC8024|nr:hypothetical protein [Gloeocapsa sp. PCC 73106]ELR96780.1 hypothetical protein GLO73106DRAFT_00005790 [Gloeocapsa sp. PCC 73106]
MKRLLLATLSTLMLSSLTTPVLASEVVPQTGPLNLVSLARQGYLKDQGVPSGDSLYHAYRSGKLTPESLVEAGIADGRVAPETINNRGYIRDVKYSLRELVDSN